MRAQPTVRDLVERVQELEIFAGIPEELQSQRLDVDEDTYIVEEALQLQHHVRQPAPPCACLFAGLSGAGGKGDAETAATRSTPTAVYLAGVMTQT